MSVIGVIALLANLVCLVLLARHRKDNLNMSSVWLCSRNDIIANISVLVAAGLVFLTGSILPDLAVGLLLTFVFAPVSRDSTFTVLESFDLGAVFDEYL